MKFLRKARPMLILLTALAVLLPGTVKAEQPIDIDLSVCNRGMTYAQMIQVCRTPEEYNGKLFRLKGKFNYSQTQELARIIFSDNTGCCEIAMVFIPAQPLIYPDDYPQLYSDIMITARLAAGQEDPDMPCCFTDAVLTRDD